MEAMAGTRGGQKTEGVRCSQARREVGSRTSAGQTDGLGGRKKGWNEGRKKGWNEGGGKRVQPRA